MTGLVRKLSNSPNTLIIIFHLHGGRYGTPTVWMGAVGKLAGITGALNQIKSKSQESEVAHTKTKCTYKSKY